MIVSFGISPEYFWDKMTESECYYLLHAIDDNRRETYSNLRLQCYYSIAPYLKENFTFRKFCKDWPLPWDNQTTDLEKNIMTANDWVKMVGTKK
jgi:hypothetical protein